MDPFSFAIMTVAQIGISYLFPAEGPRLKDLKVSASSYGAAIPWVFGLTRVPGNMIWCNPIREKKKKKSGKGGSYNDYTYFCTFAMGLCKGPVTNIRKIWADNKLIYDGTGSNNTGTGKYRFRFYTGAEDQLPDSAIESQLGGGNTPAFRGLAYILFDDMALEDFGNRIPQITAEVMVGSSELTVGVSSLTEADGATPIDASYAYGESAFDFARGTAYVRYNGKLASISLTDGKSRYSTAEFGFPAGEALSRVLCAGPDGAVFALRGEIGPTATLVRLDPFSLQAFQTQPGVPTPVGPTGGQGAVCARSQSGRSRLLTVSEAGEARQFTADDLTPLWSGTLPGSGFVAGARDPDATDVPVFFVLHRVTPSTMAITRIQGETVEQVHVFDANDPGPVLWDSAVPGVIFYYSVGYGAATRRYLAKWSEDTTEIAWTREIAGFPERFSGSSRLLTTELSWVNAGHLYRLNTATGAWLDGSDAIADGTAGQIDWQDYLDRYPEVTDDYYAGGWAQADSLLEYAQVDYTENGEDEGRTVNYIQSTQGLGVPLTSGWEGQMGQSQAYNAQTNLLINLDGVSGIIKATNIASGVSVGTIVSRLLEEGGLPVFRTDLTPLYQIPIRGYGWASGTDIKGVFDELRRIYLFDLIEREGMIVAKMRGDDNGLGVPTEVILQGALGSSSLDATDFWKETRTQEADLPATVSLAYMDVLRDFETSTARSTRITNPVPTMFSRQQVAMEVNLVMTPTEAKVQAHRMLYAQWMERTSHTSRLPWAYLNLDPADVIEVRMDDGRTYNDRIHETEIGADFITAFQSYSQDSGAYDGWDAITGDGGSRDPVVIPTVGLAVPFVINTPLLRDQDDQGSAISLYYTGFGNARSDQAWPGAGLLRSVNKVDYDVMISPDSDVEWATVVGDRLGAPHAGPFALDWKTRLVLRPAVTWFDIESVTDDELWAGANLCLVGDEVIQFRDCAENEDGTWTIWNLLRGRRGTEYACNTHKLGERVIFLSNDTIGYGFDVLSARGQERSFKAVCTGGSAADAAPLTIIYEPRDLMPYAPVDIRRTLPEMLGPIPVGPLTVSWQRRTRMGGDLMDGTPVVPLLERNERYEAYILHAPFDGDLSRGIGPGAYLRKFETTTPSFSYPSVQQIIDDFDPTQPLHVVIYQLSDAVGRGFPGVRSIEPDEEF